MKNWFIVTDIDGCLTQGRGEVVDFHVFDRLRQLHENKSSIHKKWIALITARPQPYLEMALQMIGPDSIGLFEWGCGLFDPDGYYYSYHPSLDVVFREGLAQLKAKLASILEKERLGYIQPGKEVAITIYPSSLFDVSQLHDRIFSTLHDIDWAFPIIERLSLTKTNTFVNLLPKAIDKGVGFHWLLDYLGLKGDQCLGIGDGIDDISFMHECGISATPANSPLSVKQVCDYVSSLSFGDGFVDIIDRYFEEGHNVID